MHSKALVSFLFCFLLLFPGVTAFAQTTDTPAPEITPGDLITGVNGLRVANGLPALIISDIIMGVAQTTAETMAGSSMHGHIGDVRGRIAAAGYGIGDTVWATENFATGPMELSAIIYSAWADDLHMKPMADPNYCHIGAGVATASDGTVYYIVQAAYTSNTTCSSHKEISTQQSGYTATPIISQYIIGVQTATPQPDGSLLHIVKYGQTAWHIADAYGVKIEDLINYNYYLTEENAEVYVGQHIYIPVDKMQTPTPFETDMGSSNETTSTLMPDNAGSTQVADKTAIQSSPSITEPTETLSAAEKENTPEDQGSQDNVRRLITYTVICGAVLVLIGYFTKYR